MDFTGGTKCMSAALALQAHRWRCVFSYVGGSERSKEGVGVVISGSEQVLHADNPWDALGFQAVEEFVSMFDQQAFGAAAALADRAMHNVSGPSRKQELVALKLLAEAFDAWDRFDHKVAKNKLNDVAKHDNNVRALLGEGTTVRLRAFFNAAGEHLRPLTDGASPSMRHVVDLLANAGRRIAERRMDDAVARLYRAIEALAQVRLADGYQISNTKQVPIECVPEPLRGQWMSRAHEGVVFLGLQDAYALLDSLGDDLGAKFKQMELHDPKRSLLSARNQSILAHGFERISDGVVQKLWDAALQLASAQESDILSFPRMAS